MYPVYTMEYPTSTTRLFFLKERSSNHIIDSFMPFYFTKQVTNNCEYYYVGYLIGRKSAGLMKFDKSSNILWDLNISNIISDTKYYYKFSVVNSPNYNHFYILIAVKNSSGNLETYLIKINNDGDFIWSLKLNDILHREIYGLSVTLTLDEHPVVFLRGVGEYNQTFNVLRFTQDGNLVSQVSFTSFYHTVTWVYFASMKYTSDDKMLLVLSFEGYKEPPPESACLEEKWDYLSWSTTLYKLNTTNVLDSKEILNDTINNVYFLNSDTIFLVCHNRSIIYNVNSGKQFTVYFPVLKGSYIGYNLPSILGVAPTLDGHIKIVYDEYLPFGKSYYIFCIIDYHGAILNLTRYVFTSNEPSVQYCLNYHVLLLIESDSVFSGVTCISKIIEHPGPDEVTKYLSFLTTNLSKSNNKQLYFQVMLFLLFATLLLIMFLLYNQKTIHTSSITAVVSLTYLNVLLIAVFVFLVEVAKFALYIMNIVDFSLFVIDVTCFDSPLMVSLLTVFGATVLLMNLIFGMYIVQNQDKQKLIAKLILAVVIVLLAIPLLLTFAWIFGVAMVLTPILFGFIRVVEKSKKKTFELTTIHWSIFSLGTLLLLFFSMIVEYVCYYNQEFPYIHFKKQIFLVSPFLAFYPKLYFYRAYFFLLALAALTSVILLIFDLKIRKIFTESFQVTESKPTKKGQETPVSPWFNVSLSLCILGYLFGIFPLFELVYPFLFLLLLLELIGTIFVVVSIIRVITRNT